MSHYLTTVPARSNLWCYRESILVATAILLLTSGDPLRAETVGSWQTARPAGNAGPNKNPLKGFNSGWWNPKQNFASIGYQTLEWGQLEPSDDSFDIGYVEGVLGRDGSAGRHIVVQLNVDWCCYDTLEDNYNGPAWLKNDVGVGTITGHVGNDPSKPLRQATDYNDPRFISEASEAVAWLTNYLRDDPRTFVIQTGVLGWWGEWHTYGLEQGQPGQTAKETILHAYLEGIGPEGFNGTTPGGLNGVGEIGPGGIGINGLTQVRFPEDPVNVPQAGVGYVNGSVIPSVHGYELGVEVDAHELWKNGPVGGETPPLDGVSDEELHRFFETEEGAFFLMQGRYTHVLPPEEHHLQPRLPGWTQQDEHFMAMHRLMGYNFQVQEVRHIDGRSASGQIEIEVDLQNVGIAPFYKDWDVQLAILDGNGELVDAVDLGVDLRDLDPADSTTLVATIGTSLDSGSDYQLGLRLVQPGAAETKNPQWLSSWQKLDARNVYIELANDVTVIDGSWDGNTILKGGWNILHTSPASIATQVPEPTTSVLLFAFMTLVAAKCGFVAPRLRSC